MEEIASRVIRVCLAVWTGGTVLVAIAAPVVFREAGSRDRAGAIFGEILRRFEAVKHVLSLVLVIAVFATLEAGVRPTGAALAAAIAIFVAIATNVYLAMVLRPRMNYFRMKVGSFDVAPHGGAQSGGAAPDDPWRKRFDRLHRRGTRVTMLGAFAALVALVLWP